jgi:hypothetical protein
MNNIIAIRPLIYPKVKLLEAMQDFLFIIAEEDK